MTKRIVIIILLLLSVRSAYSQHIANYAGEFLQLGAGARSLGLGGAAIAISEDVTAGYWNPAGLPALDYPMIGGMHDAKFNNTVQYDYGAIALPLGRSATVELSVFHIGINNIKDTRNAFIDRSGTGTFDGENYLDYTKVTTFGNYDWGVYLSYGQAKDSTFSYGATVKFIIRKLDADNKATGIGFDAGVRYKPMPNLTLAAVGQDITTTLLSYTSGTKELVSPTLKLGAAYSIDLFSNMMHTIIPVADLDIRFEGRKQISQVYLGPLSGDIHLGLEYQFKKIVAIRVGYSDIKALTLGAGIHLPKLSIDYAFQKFDAQDQLGNSHRISFAFSLEREKWKRVQ